MQQQQPYYVLEIHFVGRPAETLSFSAPRVVVGRDGGDIILADTEASAMHAELEFSNGQLVVRDLGSSNGTWKDGKTQPQFALSAGQSFTCGKTVINVTQIVGGQQLQAGGTVMGDGNMLAEIKRQQAAMTGAAAAAPKSKSSAPIVLGILAGVVVLGGGGFAAYTLLNQETPAAEVVADAEEVVEEEEPKLDVPLALKLDIPPVAEDTKDPEEDEPVVEKDMGELYRQVGAATVVIRTPGSVGSGSIIDPSGIILTNHHVIDGGERDGLRIKVDVTLGTFSEEMQAFEPQEDKLEAYVLEVDIDHDLALIKLIDPPSDELPTLKLCEKSPYPGQRVAAVGHAGAGLLWALKGGEVSSTGKLAGHTDLALDGASGAQKEHLEKRKAQMDKQGRVVQSTAKILPGDSGGPLVSTAGEIVGVNAFVRNDKSTGQWLSFHVHLAEVQALVEEIPEDPLDFIPDPWDLNEAIVQSADVDLDGRTETLVVSSGGFASATYFLDLDQSSLGKGERTPSWDKLSDPEDRPFDAELVVLDQNRTRNVWYDTDDDGHFDVYMLGSVGSLSDAYRVPKEGPAEKDASLLDKDGIDVALFKDADVKKRLARVGPVVFPGAVKAGDGGVAMPDPKGAATSFAPADADGDGVYDTYVESTMFHRRYVFDTDQDSNASFSMASKIKSADVEVVVIEQGPSTWVWYDTDGDKKLETVVATTMFGAQGATQALVDGKADPSQLGRSLLRGNLLHTEDDDALTRFTKGVSGNMNTRKVQSGVGIESFPQLSVGPRASVYVRDAAGLVNAVATVTELHHDIVMLDLNGDTAPAGTNHAEVAKLARAGKFDPEFAMLTVGDVRWSYYDTNGKNGFDVVLVASKAKNRTPTAGFKISKSGAIEAMEPGKSLVRSGLFKKKLRAKFEKAAPTLFPGQMTE